MKIKAIVLGILTDWGATLIFAIPIGVIGAIFHLTHGGSIKTFEAFYHSNTPLMLASLLVGSAATVGGGVVTALVAKEHQVWNSFLMGVVTSLLGIPFCFSLPLWFTITSFLLTVPCAIFGGWIVEKHCRNHPKTPSAEKA